MNTKTLATNGIFGGLLAAVIVATCGHALGFRLPPWNWSSPTGETLGQVLEWSWEVLALVPGGVLAGLTVALCAALVFEFMTHRADWLVGGIVGLFLGTLAAAAFGLVTWTLGWYGYAYMPADPPFGSSDPAWPSAIIIAMGVLLGVISGVGYGLPRHATRRSRVVRWREVSLK